MAIPLRSLAAQVDRKCTVYLSHASGEASVKGTRLVIGEGEETRTVALESIRRVVLLGRPRANSEVLYALMRAGIPVDWLDLSGRPRGQLLSLAGDQHFRLPVHQQDFAQSPKALELARSLLLAKVTNSAHILRNRTTLPDGWDHGLSLLRTATNANALRGAEGWLARLYFSCWDTLIGRFTWHGREYHPAPDPVNAMLSLGYSLLYARLASSLHANALDARIGFFHMTRGTHFALASDLMEPFRAAVDNTVLTTIRKRMVKPEQFQIKNGSCCIADKTLFSKLLEIFEEMFAASYTMYSFEDGDWRAQKRSMNDYIDDMSAYYYAILTKKPVCHAWRFAVCNDF